MGAMSTPSQEHLLVVDDDLEIRQLLRQYLKENGYRVTVAADGPQMRAALAAGFGFGTNVTLADGKDRDGVEMLGTSKVTYNVTGWFENDVLSARLAWNHRSDYAIGYTGDGTYRVT